MENQPGSAATGSGGRSTDDTTFIERVEASSFVAVVTDISTILTVLHILEVPGNT